MTLNMFVLLKNNNCSQYICNGFYNAIHLLHVLQGFSSWALLTFCITQLSCWGLSWALWHIEQHSWMLLSH